MRTSVAILILFAISFTSCSTPKTTAQFYHTHKHKEGVTNFAVPGWLIWAGGGIAQGFARDPEAKAGLKLARKARKIRFMVTEDYNPITTAEVNAFVSNIRGNGFDDLIYVKDAETAVHILAREKKDRLRNLVILVSSEEEFVFMDMKSRLRYKDISELANTLLSGDEKGQAEQPAESGEEEPVLAKKIPQA